MTELGIAFDERMLKFDSEDWRQNIGRFSPTGLVPVLWEGKAGVGFATYDSIAIIERLNELYPQKAIWPNVPHARARARSLVAEFHSEYSLLREHMPMNIRSHYPGKGLTDDVAIEIAKMEENWEITKSSFNANGEFLFGDYCAADAFFTPIASRFRTYDVQLGDVGTKYTNALLRTNAMKEWTHGALAETEFVSADEPYASPRTN